MSDSDGVSVTRLIDLVRERPVLWDRQEEVYKNRKMTKKAWSDICEVLLENYNELPEDDQRAFARSVISKWANLRDNWLRYWRKRQDFLRAGTFSSRFKKYVHHEQLMFLSKVYNPSDIQEEEVEEIQVEVDVISDPGTDSPVAFSCEELSQTPWNLGVYPEEAPQTSRNFRFNMDTPQTSWSQPIVPGTPIEQPSALEERHLYFFQSTLPLIADFSENQVIDFHSSVLESIKRVKSGVQPMNIVTTPQPAYILAIAQPPQGFLANTEVKPKELPASSVSSNSKDVKESNNTTEEAQNSKIKASEKITEVLPKENSQVNLPGKTQISDKELTDLKSAINKLSEISKKLESNCQDKFDSYDNFGKSVASFLRTLPEKRAKLVEKRMLRQMLKFQSKEKTNLTEPIEELNDINCNISQIRCETDNPSKSLLSEEKVSSSCLETTFPGQIYKTTPNYQTYQPANKDNTAKSKSKPLQCTEEQSNHDEDQSKECHVSQLISTSQFTCKTCGHECITSAEVCDHCSSQNQDLPSLKRKAEPVKRGRRGRKKKTFSSEFTT